MNIITSLFLALGLSADAFAVSVTNGMCCCRMNKKNAIATAFTFGFFQCIMPLIGYFLGSNFTQIINRYQHWVALILLSSIGINMITEAIKEKNNPEELACQTKNIFSAKNLVLQGIATSIDALAAGVSMLAMNLNIVTTSVFIGLVTFLCCCFGIFMGRKFGTILGLRARFVGGFILIVIGLKIFIEHYI
ncbi:manganese efflux pump [Mobilitalea sibirica]|uniref:Putative manganese efflux pump MntP n=1 Tax=Mobilitalea sibirica TaxID=1462919 RepID=A0A8J7H521_9FIRM|nr:manganese efflux pump MntP family protein [Mobilitalea sibirica]MBH1942257.1 manganese efflux pump [Mobilitalea sibirica]